MEFRTSATGTSLAPGSIVYLLVEVQSGGHIHEIGSRARVVGAEGDALTLEVGDGSYADTVSCPSAHVAAGAAKRERATWSGPRPRLRFTAA
jgi:hypothetical protein